MFITLASPERSSDSDILRTLWSRPRVSDECRLKRTPWGLINWGFKGDSFSGVGWGGRLVSV